MRPRQKRPSNGPPAEAGAAEPAGPLGQIWTGAGCDPGALDDCVLSGEDPVLPSVFRVGTAARAVIAAQALAAAELWRERGGRRQQVSVDMRRAAIAFCSEAFTRVLGRPAAGRWSAVSGYYPTRDGRWIQLHCQYPHLRDGVLAVLGCEEDPDAVARAVSGWDGRALERACRDRALCVALLRSPREWSDHPQSRALADLPLIEIVRIGDAPPRPLPRDGERPLSGVRVLDLTKVIAGPICGRTLASHGAEVMRVGAAHLPVLEPLIIDTGLGKRSTFVDLRDQEGCRALRELAGQADIFVQGYRPGTLEGRGFGPAEMAALRPGMVYVTLSAYGHAGPWRDWRGFDSLVQTASGIAWEGMEAAGSARPRPLPCQALDHATGYLAAFGAMVALLNRARTGGSWMVRVSLAQTGRWIDRLGRVDGLSVPMPGEEDIADMLEVHSSPWGDVLHVQAPQVMPATPSNWSSGPVPPGTHPPAWAA